MVVTAVAAFRSSLLFLGTEGGDIFLFGLEASGGRLLGADVKVRCLHFCAISESLQLGEN